MFAAVALALLAAGAAPRLPAGPGAAYDRLRAEYLDAVRRVRDPLDRPGVMEKDFAARFLAHAERPPTTPAPSTRCWTSPR
jgi:hypothetical protein